VRAFRKRYVLFQLYTEGDRIEGRHIADAIRHNLMMLFGELAVADSRLYVHSFDEETGRGILLVNERVLDRALAAASLIKSIGSVNVSFSPIRTSGTIKALQRKSKKPSSESRSAHLHSE